MNQVKGSTVSKSPTKPSFNSNGYDLSNSFMNVASITSDYGETVGETLSSLEYTVLLTSNFCDCPYFTMNCHRPDFVTVSTI